jgi:hypothetical protein
VGNGRSDDVFKPVKVKGMEGLDVTRIWAGPYTAIASAKTAVSPEPAAKKSPAPRGEAGGGRNILFGWGLGIGPLTLGGVAGGKAELSAVPLLVDDSISGGEGTVIACGVDGILVGERGGGCLWEYKGGESSSKAKAVEIKGFGGLYDASVGSGFAVVCESAAARIFRPPRAFFFNAFWCHALAMRVRAENRFANPKP